MDNVRKSFGEQTVLAGISLKVEAGQTVAVLGRSGTGKSVLLKLLIGLEQPDNGSTRIDGREIVGFASKWGRIRWRIRPGWRKGSGSIAVEYNSASRAVPAAINADLCSASCFSAVMSRMIVDAPTTRPLAS